MGLFHHLCFELWAYYCQKILLGVRLHYAEKGHLFLLAVCKTLTNVKKYTPLLFACACRQLWRAPIACTSAHTQSWELSWLTSCSCCSTGSRMTLWHLQRSSLRLTQSKHQANKLSEQRQPNFSSRDKQIESSSDALLLAWSFCKTWLEIG